MGKISHKLLNQKSHSSKGVEQPMGTNIKTNQTLKFFGKGFKTANAKML